jgi:hypothetical protein
MARPWRDVISERGWNAAVLHNRKATLGQAGAGAKLRGIFDDKYKSANDYLVHLGQRLRAYHNINKTAFERIDLRRAALEDLSDRAVKYFKVFNVDVDKASVRVAERNAYSGRLSGGDPALETADRNILSLARRSLRKREYLRLLKAFYAGTGAFSANADALFAYLAKPQEKSDGLIGLTPGVRMEQLDFMHRGDFETDDMGSISCGAAFDQWTQDIRCSTVPFFLWLEDHPVCLEDQKDRLETGSVEYAGADKRSGGIPIAKLRLVIMGGRLTMIDLHEGLANKRVATTGDCKAEGAKDPRAGQAGDGSNFIGQGVAAYVWTQEKELFIAQHMGQQFHHSSFVSGGAVRCAGMISIENGQVTALSNNSGHYKPRKDHVRNFVIFLQQVGALANGCVLRVHVGGGYAWRGNVADFLRNFDRVEDLAEAQSKVIADPRGMLKDMTERVADARNKGLKSVTNQPGARPGQPPRSI